MVVRPSLKRVVPGSVPPWRVLCAESARALKAFFSILCVSKSALLLESKFRQLLRALNLCAFWVRPSCPRVGRGRSGPRCSFCGLADRWSRARFLLRARVFRGPVVVSGCRNVFRGRAVVFHFRQSRRRGSLSSSLRLIRSLGTFAVETLLALRGPELPSWRGLQRIACRLPICLVRRSPIFAVRHLLRRSRCARALLPLCFRCVLVWKLTLGSGPGWVGLRSELLIDVAMKISMSQIL